MASTNIKDVNNDYYLKVNPDGSINVDGTVNATNPSVGPTGTTAPTSGTEIAGIDPSGNLHPVAVDVNGAVKVVGNLTTSDGFSSLTPGYPTQIAVGTTSVTLLSANPLRKYGHFFNNSSEAIFIQFQATAALNQGIKVGPGSFFTLELNNLWLGDINAIGLMTGQLISVVEGI